MDMTDKNNAPNLTEAKRPSMQLTRRNRSIATHISVCRLCLSVCLSVCLSHSCPTPA